MLSLLTENKVASIGGVAIVTGVVLMLSASSVDTGPVPNDEAGMIQLSNINKRKTLMAIGGSVMSLGVLAQVYDQYTRFRSSSSSGFSSSQMSPAELHRFQDRVSSAAEKLRRSIRDTPDVDYGTIRDSASKTRFSPSSSSSARQESASELAARASAQISSFIQNYS